MKPEQIAILCLFAFFALLEAWRTGFFNKPNEKPDDKVVEMITAVLLLFLSQPFAAACGFGLASVLAPESADILLSWSPIAVLGLFLIFDDMTQYWWHRASHTLPWLYKLHRPHHNAEYLSVRVVYRNNIFYYAFMPGLWFSGALIYLGGGWVYMFYLPVKMLVIYGAHSDVHWDEKLYKVAWLSPIMWVVERTISTPSTHSAHHGKYASDGITNYHGNFGNLLFFWDVLFGSAKITRRYPEEYGVENLEETSAAEQILWPIVRSSNSIAEQNDKAADS